MDLKRRIMWLLSAGTARKTKPSVDVGRSVTKDCPSFMLKTVSFRKKQITNRYSETVEN